jgi:hypothetical protein
MSLQKIKSAIVDKKMRCPSCGQPIQQFEKYTPMLASAYDGPGSSLDDEPSEAAKVTLICGNGSCDWKERTEYWSNYID